MTTNISPVLLADRRVKTSVSDVTLDGRQVLLTLLHQRFQNLLISDANESEFLQLIGEQNRIGQHANCPIGVLLEDYTAKLKSDVRYGEIWKSVKLRNPAKQPLDDVSDNVVESISERFLQYRLDMFVDDRIMMSFLMATELISEAVQGGQCARASTIFNTVTKLLCSIGSNKTSISATPQIINSWLLRYEELINPERKCDILVSFKPACPPLPPIKASDSRTAEKRTLPLKRKVIVFSRPRSNSTEDSNKQPIDGASSTKSKISWYSSDKRVELADSKSPQTNSNVLHSYIYNRFVEENFGAALIKKFLLKKKLIVNYKKRALGVAMSDYGNAISAKEEYAKIKREVFHRINQQSNAIEAFFPLVSKYILNLDEDFLLFDRLITVFQLASDISNDFMSKGDSEGAFMMYSTTTSELNAYTRSSLCYSSRIWKQFVELKEELVNRTKFDLLSDRTFIYPERNYAPLSTDSRLKSRAQVEPLIVHPYPRKFIVLIRTSQRSESAEATPTKESKLCSTSKAEKAGDSDTIPSAKNPNEKKFPSTSTIIEAKGANEFGQQVIASAPQKTIITNYDVDNIRAINESKRRSQLQPSNRIVSGLELKKQTFNTDPKPQTFFKSSQCKEQHSEGSVAAVGPHSGGAEVKAVDNEQVHYDLDKQVTCSAGIDNDTAAESEINPGEYYVNIDDEGGIGTLQYGHVEETLSVGVDNTNDGDAAQTMDDDDEPDEEGWYTSGSSKFRVT